MVDFDFADVADWTAYLRDLIARPGAHPELGKHGTMGTRSSVGALAATLAGSPYLDRLLDAGLALVERGTPEEVAIAGTLPFGAVQGDRVLEVLAARATTLPEEVFDVLIDAALEHRPLDPRVPRALEARAASAPHEAAALLKVALARLPAWVIQHVPRFASASHDPRGRTLAALLARSHPIERGALLDAIAAAGPDYMARTLAGVRDSSFPDAARERIRAELAAHPAFRDTEI